MALRLADVCLAHSVEMSSQNPGRVEKAIKLVASAVGDFDATSLAASELSAEFAAMVGLYRAVRKADAFMQSALRSSDVAEALLGVYYALRTIQAGLSMRYAMESRELEQPDTSPLGTAIGLFDAPKVLAQPTHLTSGSYDASLPRFVRWMQEIWRDMAVRRADYLRFYGEDDVVAATTSLREILDLGDDGQAHLREFAPGRAHDPAALLDRLARWAGEGTDLIDAARAIQEVGQEARSSLVALLAHREAYEKQMGSERVAIDEAQLQRAINWRFPVLRTPLFDLAAEQGAFDELLARVPSGAESALPSTEDCAASAETALRRACLVEQSLRDHAEEYRARYSDARERRSFRWYVWEFLNLLDRARRQPTLGARH